LLIVEARALYRTRQRHERRAAAESQAIADFSIRANLSKRWRERAAPELHALRNAA
jgi:hypothetical protein